MLIAHLPAGYVFARGLRLRGREMAAALAGAVAPDLDMIWFYLVDSSVHHHRFWPHIPALWLGVALIGLPLLARFARGWLAAGVMFLAAVFLHLLLDSVAGSVMWLWPWNDRLYELVTVPATQDHWVLSFMLHWSFGLELAICALALWLFWRR